ncbi:MULTISPECIES: hypothetical protein [Chryseobacterium]|uniref:Uncharacterized protein n=1 Tax=Chryseobacterium taihuense TaxID=1141221 RepID=A0ABY0R1M7_9FLAO|nr:MULTISPECIES: hypothetical protein [Chryseobacterium]SDM25187.1 hypothetical protein SAMN05216273_11883 [Chryseobacterium taihuense]
MSKPIFIDLTDFNDNVVSINANHIIQISEYEHPKDKDIITTVSYYLIPDCTNCQPSLFKTPERRESILNRIRLLSLRENN